MNETSKTTKIWIALALVWTALIFQRAHILEAAWRVFARKGTAATMAEIAAEASVSNGLVYHYFPTKEALLAELVERSTQGSLNRVRQTKESSHHVESNLILSSPRSNSAPYRRSACSGESASGSPLQRSLG